jgi:molybdopterin-guanine dinucleotide biosynthesis protein A
MGASAPLEIGGYVLAGGKSFRMGSDKALLQLGGKPLIEHAVRKLRRICTDVHILAGEPGRHDALAAYAPLVHDLHPGSGPVGGIEAALAHSRHEWNLILPVDVPFLPSAFLAWWARTICGRRSMRIRVASFTVSGVAQSTCLMIHRDAAPFLTLATARGELRLLPALESAARGLALPDAAETERRPYMLPIDENFRFDGWQEPEKEASWRVLTPAQRNAQSFWFANLNTPEDFLRAEENIDALDT